MAKMIPSVISPEVKSTAEKRIFKWFRDASGTEDWIVLHSLGISNHNRVIHGETDFFVMIPYMGIFAIEVKGGRVTRKDGIWTYTDKDGNIGKKERGPFDQAWDGIFSIINDVKSKLDSTHRYLERIFFGIGVMLPDVEYTTVGCDEEQWQVFDCNDGCNVREYMHRVFIGACDKWKKLNGEDVPLNKLPTIEDINYIASLLRGDFDRAVAISAQIRYVEEELIRLTNEQYRCIDQLDDNKRCLIEGGAGTGKTLLALEEAKKAVASGMKVAIFCYNKNLGDWFVNYFREMPASLRPAYVGTFHRYMSMLSQMAGVRPAFPSREDNADTFFSEDLPIGTSMALNQLQNERFDKIIVDEAQDLITKRYLEVFDKCLSGGLVRGKWTLFGDFSQQAIYSVDLNGNDMKNMLEEMTSFIRFKLTINCRNTKTICDEISLVTGYPAPSEVWSNLNGLPVQYLTYVNRVEEKERLVNTIRMLLDSNVPPKKICILSPLIRENSIVSEIEEYDIADYKIFDDNRLSFCTISAFKGLENSVIILVDIESIANKNLMYVALSRARAALYVIKSEAARSEYVAMQMRRLSSGHKT